MAKLVAEEGSDGSLEGYLEVKVEGNDYRRRYVALGPRITTNNPVRRTLHHYVDRNDHERHKNAARKKNRIPVGSVSAAAPAEERFFIGGERSGDE